MQTFPHSAPQKLRYPGVRLLFLFQTADKKYWLQLLSIAIELPAHSPKFGQARSIIAPVLCGLQHEPVQWERSTQKRENRFAAHFAQGVFAMRLPQQNTTDWVV